MFPNYKILWLTQGVAFFGIKIAQPCYTIEGCKVVHRFETGELR